MVGTGKEKKKALNAYLIEEKIAEVQLSRTDSRDPEKIYNPFSKEELNNLGQGEWASWISYLELDDQKRFLSLIHI